jgi:hypothetical protein
MSGISGAVRRQRAWIQSQNSPCVICDVKSVIVYP